MALGYPTTSGTYESQQFGPVPYGVPGYFSQPAMYASGATVAWWQPYKGWTYYGHYHNGLDVAGAEGLALRALESGKVIFSGWKDNGGGLVIEVEIRPGTRYTFNHCSKLLAPVGVRVSRGQIIASIGASGVATGSHCHLSLDILERGPDGVSRWLMWNPKHFMSGGPYQYDPRIVPLSYTPPTTESTAMEAWQVPLRYRLATGTKTVKAGKPYRTKASVSQAPAGTFAADTAVRLIGRFPKTGSYDDWYLVDWYRGNGYGEAIVTSVDFK